MGVVVRIPLDDDVVSVSLKRRDTGRRGLRRMHEDADFRLAVDARRLRLLQRPAQVAGSILLGLNDDPGAGSQLFRADCDHVVHPPCSWLEARGRSGVLKHVAGFSNKSRRWRPSVDSNSSPCRVLFADSSRRALHARIAVSSRARASADSSPSGDAAATFGAVAATPSPDCPETDSAVRLLCAVSTRETSRESAESSLSRLNSATIACMSPRQGLVQVAVLAVSSPQEPDQRAVLVVQLELSRIARFCACTTPSSVRCRVTTAGCRRSDRASGAAGCSRR